LEGSTFKQGSAKEVKRTRVQAVQRRNVALFLKNSRRRFGVLPHIHFFYGSVKSFQKNAILIRSGDRKGNACCFTDEISIEKDFCSRRIPSTGTVLRGYKKSVHQNRYRNPFTKLKFLFTFEGLIGIRITTGSDLEVVITNFNQKRMCSGGVLREEEESSTIISLGRIHVYLEIETQRLRVFVGITPNEAKIELWWYNPTGSIYRHTEKLLVGFSLTILSFETDITSTNAFSTHSPESAISYTCYRTCC
jgi:hypothetical protein